MSQSPDSKVESSWYPGFIPIHGLNAEQIRCLTKLLKYSPSDLSTDEVGVPDMFPVADAKTLVTSLYQIALKCSNVATQLHEQLVETKKQNEKLEASITEFGIRHRKFIQDMTNTFVDIKDATHKAKKELDVVNKQNSAYHALYKQIRESMVCPICDEVALLPKVLGVCGHIACGSCMKRLDEVAYSTLTMMQTKASEGSSPVSARQHLLSRRCPLCRMEIIGRAFPCLALKNITNMVVDFELSADDNEHKSLDYTKETVEDKHTMALEVVCWGQSQLAQHSVSAVIHQVRPWQWKKGVYILCEASVSRVFFETFATTLHGKAGGVSVLINPPQRLMIARLSCRCPSQRHDHVMDEDEKLAIAQGQAQGQVITDRPFLLKMKSDGRFVISQCPESNSKPPLDSSEPGPVITGLGAAES